MATDADAVLANAPQRELNGFDIEKEKSEAVYKDAYIPPLNDTTTPNHYREANTSY